MLRLCSFFFTLSIMTLVSAAGAQTQGDLISGAYTDVPPSAQPGYVSLVDGSPLHIMSAVTGIEFHVPGKISSEPGGLSSVPIPVLRIANGVEYWFISGELSGYVTEENGQHIAIGPIDPAGVNHRQEGYCSVCPEGFEHPLCCSAETSAHPRAGLPGAFFAFLIPAEGFHGGMIQIEPAADGGFNLPSAPFLWNAVDQTLLLAQGYAVFTMGPGGSVPRGMLDGENWTIDTNPYSGSGIFWQELGFETEDALASYTRFAFFDEESGMETALPGNFVLPIPVPLPPDGGQELCEVEFECSFENEACICHVPFGHPEFVYGSIMIWNPEIIGDSAIFAKNLMAALFQPVTWAAYIGWSGSGAPAMQLASSTHGGLFQANRASGPQAAGGNYNVWGDPESGLRFDAFLAYAGFQGVQAYLDHFDDMPDVNPDFPASAPFVWFVPGYDSGGSGAEPSGAYRYANKVWQALDNLGRGKEINNFMRIYHLPKATHQHPSQLYASFDDRENMEGGLWFEYSDIFPKPGAFNEAGKGYRIKDAYVDSLRYNPRPDGWDFYYQGLAKAIRDAPLWVQTLANLRQYSEKGTPLPVSRVDPRIFKDIKAVSTETVLPDYPVIEFPWPDPFSEEVLFALVNEIAHSIKEDTGTLNYNPREDEVEAFQIFAQKNRLKRSTDPLLLPDALPLAWNFYFFDTVYQGPFTEKEFKAHYGSQLGYVIALTKVTFKLIQERLWDPEMGIAQLSEALNTPIDLSSEDSLKAPAKWRGRFIAPAAKSKANSLANPARGAPDAKKSGWRARYLR